MADTQYAFRCRNCNALEEASHAGESARPHACRFCGAGVSWAIVEGQPVKTLDPDNWIVLADLSDHELAPILKFHGITAEQVERHEAGPPADPGREPQLLSVHATEGTTTEEAIG